MAATVMDGKKVAATIREEVKAEVAAWREQGVSPRLDVILVGEDPASVYYAQAKERLSKRVGIDFECHRLSETATEAEVLALLDTLNNDSAVHGIMVELPLPKGMSKDRILGAVNPLKDVDGVNPLNQGYLALELDGLFPATPLACMEMLDRYELPVRGQEAVIVGWGATVGKPLLNMMLGRRATATTTHSRTRDLAAHTRKADIVIAAVGRPGMITADMIKPGAVVIDVAINETAEGIVGDVDYAAVSEVAGYVTPVPGGVGSVTTVLLFKNLLKGMKMQMQAKK
jgi:methylenetetrahydrofolate dehydrogenase (NADP+)/methenyltetrahydrofolate cyclohydrolase